MKELRVALLEDHETKNSFASSFNSSHFLLNSSYPIPLSSWAAVTKQGIVANL